MNLDSLNNEGIVTGQNTVILILVSFEKGMHLANFSLKKIMWYNWVEN